MKRWRIRAVRGAPLALALFVASVAAPHSGLVYHTHPGGEHAHVHLEDGEGEPHQHLEHHHHEHDQAHEHHRRGHPNHLVGHDAHGTEIEAPDGDARGHWHVQNPFHRVVAVAAPQPYAVQTVERIAAPRAGVPPDPPAPGSRARAPPVPP